jgi:hypothetical protein
MTATAIMCSGVNAAKALKMFEHMNLQMFSSRTYTRLQSLYVAPSATVTWDSEQATLLHDMHNRPVVLGGDARCDSPGYSAKYGSYTLMDLVTKNILDFQLVQVCMSNFSYVDWRFMCSNIFKAFAALTPLHMMAVAVMRFDQGILLCDD